MHEWTLAINAYTTWLIAGDASRGTIKLRLSYLRRFSVAQPNPWDVKTRNLLDWLAADRSWSSEAKKSARSSLRSFYKWAQADDETPMTTNPAAALPAIRVPLAKAKPAPTHVVVRAYARADRRERLMVTLGNECGLRGGEICKVRGSDLLDNDMLHVVGKGGRERVVPVSNEELLEALIEAGDGYLFPGNFDGHISPNWTYKLLSRLLGPGWTGHKLRHRAGTRGFRGTHNIRAVQEFLGHASVRTTQIYTAVDEDDIRAVGRAAAA